MTTYNTYQEAKIANPDCEIFEVAGDGFNAHDVFATGSDLAKFNFGKHTFTLCKPSDHCMTLGELRDSHGGEQAGDLILGYSSGSVKVIKNIDSETRSFDRECFVLRAAALENQMNIDKVETQTPETMQPRAKHFEVKKDVHLRDCQKKAQTEHQEGMSAFSGEAWYDAHHHCNYHGLNDDVVIEFEHEDSNFVEKITVAEAKRITRNPMRHTKRWRLPLQTKEVEWENGDFAIYEGSVVMVIAYHPKHPVIVVETSTEEYINVGICDLSKPENQQQREDRERLEAAYDLYVTWRGEKPEALDTFKRCNHDNWLAIVDKTNYRKGVK